MSLSNDTDIKSDANNTPKQKQPTKEAGQKLKPCPFCGSAAKMHIQPEGSYRVHCTETRNCGIGTKYTSPFALETASAMWNKRV